LHRAAFQGFHEVVQLLLERGSDPRIKDRQAELPFDVASNDETRKALESWDVAKTDKLKEERDKAQDIEDEKMVRNDEERQMLAKRKKTLKMAEYAEKGEKDSLEVECMELEVDQGNLSSYRDDRGNTMLHIAAEHDRIECVIMLIEEMKMDPNIREAKGWTPVAIAAFRGHKKLCQELMSRRGDPEIQNAYRKDAFDVAQDDEIKQCLKVCLDGPRPVALDNAAGGASSSSAPAAGDEETSDEPKAKAKAKGKAKAEAKDNWAKAGAKAKAKAKAEAKPKADAKPRAKSRPK